MTTEELEQAYKELREGWQRYKGRFKRFNRQGDEVGKWAGCGRLMAHHKKEFRDLLKDYELKDLLRTQDNYALVLLHKHTGWTYAWNLYQFWTRGLPYDRKIKQFIRFMPPDFSIEDYIKEDYRNYLKNPKYKQQLADFYDKALPNKIGKLPQGKCAQKAVLDKLKE